MCKDCVAGARILNRNAGLRRAQELAKEYAETFADTSEIYWEQSDRVIDAEAKKG